MDKVEEFFKLKERGSTIGTEIRAGCTTFLTLGYILAVNPMILADSGGSCTCDGPGCIFGPDYLACVDEVKYDLVMTTALTSGIACLLMGVVANLPFALAPGMGMNAYFTYGVVGWRGTGAVSYGAALTAIFIEGIIFCLVSAAGLRIKIVQLIPKPVRIATSAGIGLFLCLLGMQTAEGIGLIVSDTATGITFGGCAEESKVPLYACPNTKGIDGVPDGIATVGPGAFDLFAHDKLANWTPWYDCLAPTNNVYTCDRIDGFNPGVDGYNTNGRGVFQAHGNPTWFGGTFTNPRMWLGIVGFFIIAIMMKLKMKGSIIVAVLICSVVSWVPGDMNPFTYFPDTPLGETRFTYFKKVVDLRTMSTVLFQFANPFGDGETAMSVIAALLTFFFIDFLDTSATLLAVADVAGFVKDKEKPDFEGLYPAYLVDGFATSMGSLFGTSPVTTYIESAPGILEGGKTGLTAVVVAFWFFLSMFFAPILASIPAWCTGSALIITGALMMRQVIDVNWKNEQEAIPAFMTIVLMPFGYSIFLGLFGGIVTWLIMAIPDFAAGKNPNDAPAEEAKVAEEPAETKEPANA
jgi:AGZA family xanthine/uracil permease-like MFS transporter